MKVIITGATGMVGEGVLLECLAHPDVKEVLVVGRKPTGIINGKLKELLVSDFMKLDEVKSQLAGYDASFYCAGISSVGMKEAAYSHITYDITMNFAKTLAKLNSNMVFNYVSGLGTDSSGQGRTMWAKVKGRTEQALMYLPFKRVFNFRPGLIKPSPGQKNIQPFNKLMGSLYPLVSLFFPNGTSTMQEIGLAMIKSVHKGYNEQILEVKDIKQLAKA